MKKRFLLFSFLFVQGIFVLAQSRVLDYELELIPENLKINHSFNKQEGLLGISMVHQNSVEHFLLKKNNTVIQFSQNVITGKSKNNDTTATIPIEIRQICEQVFVGGLAYTNTILEAYNDNRENTIYIVTTNFLNSSSCITDTIKLSSKENLVSAFEQNNNLYFFTSFTKSDKIRIYKKEISEKVTFLEKILSNTAYRERSKKRNNNFSDLFETEFSVIEKEKQYPLSITEAPNKFYIFPGKLLFTSDNNPQVTLLLEVNIETLSTQSWAIPKNNGNSKSKKMVSNSIVIDSIIIQASVAEENLHLSFSNLFTGELYKTYTDNGIDGTLFGKNVLQVEKRKNKMDSSFTDVKRLLKKIKQNQVALSVKANNDDIEVNIGAIYVRNYTFASTLLSIAASALGTYGINSIPNVMGFAVGIFSLHGLAGNTISINILFNKKDFSFTDGIGVNSIENNSAKLGSFLAVNKVNKKNAFLIETTPGQYYLGWFDMEDSKLYVYYF